MDKLINCRYNRCKELFKPLRWNHYYHQDKCRKADWEERYGHTARNVKRRLDDYEKRIARLESVIHRHPLGVSSLESMRED